MECEHGRWDLRGEGPVLQVSVDSLVVGAQLGRLGEVVTAELAIVLSLLALIVLPGFVVRQEGVLQEFPITFVTLEHQLVLFDIRLQQTELLAVNLLEMSGQERKFRIL